MLFTIGLASANDYYVSTSGNDYNDGLSIENPWATPSYAAQKAHAGDTIYLLNCTWYNEHVIFYNSGNITHPITITAYNGTPILDGVDSNRIGISTNSKSNININNIEFRNYKSSIYVYVGSNITISNTIIEVPPKRILGVPVYKEGIRIYNGGDKQSTNNITINNNKVNVLSDEYSVSLTEGAAGIVVSGNYISVTNNTVNGHSANSIQIIGRLVNTEDVFIPHHIYIRNNIVSNNSAHSGLDVSGDISDFFVEGNEFNRANGMFSHKYTAGYGVDRLIYNNNIIHDTTRTDFTGTRNSIIENNTFYNITGNAIYSYILAGQTINATVKNNTIYNATSSGIRLSSEYGYLNIIDNNLNEPSYYVVEGENTSSLLTFTKYVNTFDLGVGSFGNVHVKFTDNRVFKFVQKYGVSGYNYTNPMWYPEHSNFTIGANLVSSPTLAVTTYPMTARPTINPATITVNKFDTSLSQGNILVDFTANTTDGNNVAFTVNELQPNQNYLIKKDGTNFTTTQANSTGYIQFSNSEWSEHTFTIEETLQPDAESGTPVNKDPVLPEYWNYYEGAGSGDWGRTTDEAHTGNYSVFLRGTDYYQNNSLNIGLVAGDSNGYSGLNAYDATPDTTYNVSFWIKGDFNSINPQIGTWNTEDGSGNRNWISTSIGQVIPTGTWTQYQGTFTTPSDAKKLILMFKAYGDTSLINLGTIYVDDVEICASPNIVLNPSAENLSANNESPLDSVVSITSSITQTTPGETFTLTIPITPATPLTGAQFDLLFDNSLATVTTVTEGNLLNQDGATTLFNSGTINNAAGTVTNIYGLILGATSVSSQGSLATISMTAGSTTGYLDIDLTNVKISDANSVAAPYTLTNATVLIDTAPVLSSIGAKSVDEGNALIFTTGASDVDGDSLTYTATNLPAGASFNTATGAFSWTPVDGEAGTYVVTFEVTDGYISDSEDVTITVNDGNNVPVITTFVPANSLTFNELDVITVGIIATDADGDALTYNIKIDGVTKSTSSSYVWETDYSSAGSHTIDIIVSDGIEQVTDSRTITINDVRPRWDVNEDGTVNVLDISIIGQKYGTSVGAPYPRWDVNQDGAINVQDMTLTASHFGETVA